MIYTPALNLGYNINSSNMSYNMTYRNINSSNMSYSNMSYSNMTYSNMSGSSSSTGSSTGDGYNSISNAYIYNPNRGSSSSAIARKR